MTARARLPPAATGRVSRQRRARSARAAEIATTRSSSGSTARPPRTADLVARTGVDPELLERVLQAAGVAVPSHGDAAGEERDLALPALVAALADLGIDEEAVVELARTLGESAARIGAAAIIGLGSGLTRPGDTEQELGARLAAATHPVNAHLADAVGLLIRAQTIDQLTAVELDGEQIADGRIAGATPVSIAFADVVGFTRMGEQLGAQRPRNVAEDFPRIRGGVATGDAVPRAGDWFGPPVNRAARVCAAARPESVLVDDGTRERLADDAALQWTGVGRVHLKGMGRVRLHRVRRAGR